MSMTLGAQLYTVREFTKTPEGIEKTLRRRAANMYRLKNMLCKRKEQ